MDTYRFIHSSDLHLGKPFGRFDAELSSRLREARHYAISRLATAARDNDVGEVLLAGDIWDSETPANSVLTQSLAAFAQEDDIIWRLLPGNHDLVGAGGLWERIAADCPGNVAPVLYAEPVAISEGVWLLPAPCHGKDLGRDVTAWMDAAPTPEGALRIGLAHGPVQGFGDNEAQVISPDRAQRAGLDYLALGDWHGWVRVNDRTYYPGTPEPDRFRDGSGFCALVRLTTGGAPDVKAVEIARHHWIERDVDLSVEPDPQSALTRLTEGRGELRNILISLALRGVAAPDILAAWSGEAEGWRPRLAWLDFDVGGVETLYAADDLDRIDRAGALRQAAEGLRAEASDVALSANERTAAQLALDTLYSWSIAEGGDR